MSVVVQVVAECSQQQAQVILLAEDELGGGGLQDLGRGEVEWVGGGEEGMEGEGEGGGGSEPGGLGRPRGREGGAMQPNKGGRIAADAGAGGRATTAPSRRRRASEGYTVLPCLLQLMHPTSTPPHHPRRVQHVAHVVVVMVRYGAVQRRHGRQEVAENLLEGSKGFRVYG